MGNRSASRIYPMPIKLAAAIGVCLCAALCLALASCGGRRSAAADPEEEREMTLSVFAASSLTETLTELGEQYQLEHPRIRVVFSFGASGDLARQIQSGAECDLFLSGAYPQMDYLDGALRSDPARNPEKLNLLWDGTRVDLLENRVVLAVPEGNPGGVESFSDLARRLRAGEVFAAVGGPDVSLGWYTRRIFDYENINEDAVSSCLTYGSSAKEAATLTASAAVDCGIVYATDAVGLEVIDEAGPEMCGRVAYPAAVLSESAHRPDALEFLDYLSTPEASALFAAAGFTPLAGT